MPRSLFKAIGLLAIVLAMVLFLAASSTIFKTVSRAVVSPMALAFAHSGANSAAGDTAAATEKDTVTTPEEKKAREEKERSKDTQYKVEKKSKEGTLSIKIDESGIRIEGEGGNVSGTDTTGHRIIFDSGDWTTITGGRTYRERGTDIVKFGEDVRVDADELVRGDVVVFGGDVTVAGKVIGNVVVFGGDAILRSGAEINGDVVVLAGDLEEQPEVLIHGERVNFQKLNLSFTHFPFFFGRGMRFFELFIIPAKFFISVLLSFLIVLFLKGRVVRSQEHVTAGVFKTFGAGFLVAFIGLFVVSFLTIVLLITLIGIPLAFVLIVSCVAVFIIADTVFVYALGSKVNEKLNIQIRNPFGIVLIGTAVLYLPALLGFGFSLLPFGRPLGAMFEFLGWMLGFFAFLAGLGALFLSRFGTRSVPVGTAGPVPANPD